MGAAEILIVRETFHLSQRALAKSMNVAPLTVQRWERGESTPTGLQEEVLQALHRLAVQMRSTNDEAQVQVIRGLLVLGIGALIFYLLAEKAG